MRIAEAFLNGRSVEVFYSDGLGLGGFEVEGQFYPFLWDEVFILVHFYLSGFYGTYKGLEEGCAWFFSLKPGSLILEYKLQGKESLFIFKGPEYRNVLSFLVALLVKHSRNYSLYYPDYGIAFSWSFSEGLLSISFFKDKAYVKRVDLTLNDVLAVAFSHVDVGLMGKFRIEKDKVLVGKDVFEGDVYVKLIRGACHLFSLLS